MENSCRRVLGLDLGVASIGWALLECDSDGQPQGLVASGVRVFEPGMEGDISAGRAESRNLKRRDARLARRQTDRRRRRRRKIFGFLQQHGLLPGGEAEKILPDLDKELLKKHQPAGTDATRFAHLLPYFLRTRSLDERLEPFELGRAIYHLAQRRGFKSNRKTDAAEDPKDLGPVKQGIADLDKRMKQANARTLGEFFFGLDPEQERIRSQWTARDMYEREFNAIIDSQSAHHPTLLTPEMRKELFKCLFDQRPLKSTADLIGPCELERDRRRAPWARLEAQRFRILQRVLDTRLLHPNGAEEKLTPEQTQALKDALDKTAYLTFVSARKLLEIRKGVRFNWEEGGEKSFKGNTTNAKLAGVLGDRWYGMPYADRCQVVEDLHSFQKEEALCRRGRTKWGLPKNAAQAFSKLALEEDYCRLSTKALNKLRPLMENGTPYATAVKEVYGEFHRRVDQDELLPAVWKTFPALLNPTVNRMLNELRKVVNAVVQQHGCPDIIRVELARDMRKSKKQRQEFTKRNRKNESNRDRARNGLEKLGITNPKQDDIVKWQLYEECNGECPYTGRTIDLTNLFGPAPQFDVEHIIPFSRSLDNSFLNKTLCYHGENRNEKRNQTPWEAYSHDQQKYDTILQRVKSFSGDAKVEKLRRFKKEDVDDDIEEWASRQLNDTRYASKLAVQYLGLLYGGREDESGNQRIFATSGGATGHVRAVWNMNSLLNDGPHKTRDDHRHHAVDAIAIALTTPGTIKMLSDAAEHAWQQRSRRFAPVPEPWPGFLPDIRAAVDSIKISHRASRKARGAMHNETNYSPPRTNDNGKQVVHVRRLLIKPLTASEVEAIVDPAVQQAVQKKLAELGGDLSAFKDKANHPVLVSKDGASSRPIHKVRVRQSVAVTPVGRAARQRFVASGSNHHMEIFKVKDKRGNTKWDAEVVSMFDAIQRKKNREPIVRSDRPGFVCSITSGDMALLEDQGVKKLVVISSVWEEQGGSKRIQFCEHTDARIKKGLPKKAVNALRQMSFQKVIVTPFGEIRRAND